MPTLSLSYLLLPNHRNLWKEPAASILDPKGLHKPPDPSTGEATQEQRDREIPRQAQFWAINGTLQATRPLYLVGSGASAFGTMRAFPRTLSWSCWCARAWPHEKPWRRLPAITLKSWGGMNSAWWRRDEGRICWSCRQPNGRYLEYAQDSICDSGRRHSRPGRAA